MAVAGLNALVFASAIDGAEAIEGVNIKDLAARPRRSVGGMSVRSCVSCAAAIDGIPSK